MLHSFATAALHGIVSMQDKHEKDSSAAAMLERMHMRIASFSVEKSTPATASPCSFVVVFKPASLLALFLTSFR